MKILNEIVPYQFFIQPSIESGRTLCVCNSYITSLSDNMRECCSLVGSIRRTSNFLSHPSLVLFSWSFLSLDAAELRDKHLETVIKRYNANYGSYDATTAVQTHLSCNGTMCFVLDTAHCFNTELNILVFANGRNGTDKN